LHHGLTLPLLAHPGIHGGWIAVVHHYHSDMAQNFWTAIWAFSACFLATIGVSLATRQRKSDEELAGLVYALTPRPKENDVPWHKRPAILGLLVLTLTLVLNIVFW
jgi:SSS family solute:Na+ symporter